MDYAGYVMWTAHSDEIVIILLAPEGATRSARKAWNSKYTDSQSESNSTSLMTTSIIHILLWCAWNTNQESENWKDDYDSGMTQSEMLST